MESEVEMRWRANDQGRQWSGEAGSILRGRDLDEVSTGVFIAFGSHTLTVR